MLALGWAGSNELEHMPRVLRVHDPHAGWRRQHRRHFARTQRQIEQTPQYQRDLAHLAELASQLRAELPPATDAHWLDLEEALLSHAAKLARLYFRAGFTKGAALARRNVAREHDAMLTQLAHLLTAFVKSRSG